MNVWNEKLSSFLLSEKGQLVMSYLEKFNKLYPYLFIAQCFYFIAFFKRTVKRHSFFGGFACVMGGSSLTYLLLLKETPGWLNHDRFFNKYCMSWLFMTLPFMARIYEWGIIKFFGFLMYLMATSHIVLNACVRVSAKYPSTLGPIVIGAFLAGCVSVLITGHKDMPRKRRLESAQVFVTTALTLLLYLLLNQHDLIAKRIPESWPALPYIERTLHDLVKEIPTVAVPELRRVAPWLAAMVATLVGLLMELVDLSREIKEQNRLHKAHTRARTAAPPRAVPRSASAPIEKTKKALKA
eukprot:gnl/Trimastix_PCT/1366.p2 GENE.gnl/Trimastix_PCT/1366~~gnl/Trimastix_PCT/1366.p2  ORF type:complete len:297 (+),score=106.98 gnl/Trimastix_PCT/1366:752-1642(+)